MAGTVADKLALLQQTKTNIRAAIVEKGQTVADTDPFSAYPDKIRAISGGGGLDLSKPLDPMEVYKATRPAEWGKMPEPAANEAWLLILVPEGGSGCLAFTATTGGGTYSVEFGDMPAEGGTFSPFETMTGQASGVKFEKEIPAAASGMRQVLVKITGELTNLTFAKYGETNIFGGNIVEISLNMPAMTKLRVSVTTTGVLEGCLTALRYLTVKDIGVSGIAGNSFFAKMFSGCSGLVCVPEFSGISSWRMISSAHEGCSSLLAPTIIVPKGASGSGLQQLYKGCSAIRVFPDFTKAGTTELSCTEAFSGCTALTKAPNITASLMGSAASMFYGCTAMSEVGELNLHGSKDISSIFSGCSSLATIQKLTLDAVTNATDAFAGCYNLSSLRLDPTVTGWAGVDLDLSQTALGRAGIVALFNSLPTITAAHSITLTGTPGAASLTDADKAIATGKGWTVVTQAEGSV